jgi:cellulose synthase/poly-beta-1,6-N-acetylglucosamine synthase-like glycosyltransferase
VIAPDLLYRILYGTNTLFLVYFAVANICYTVLMAISLYSVSMQTKSAARKDHESLSASPVTPPIAVIVPAYNEEAVIVQTVLSLLEADYPEKEIIVVDDGSTDRTLERLAVRFSLVRMDLIYREHVATSLPIAIYRSTERPELTVIAAEHRGKPHALNTGINTARSPYFCTVDADSVLERDALLRLMAGVVESPENTVVSGGVIRIANGCTVRNGRIKNIDLPKSWVERCQAVEYIRTFMFGRAGWSALGATFVAAGAFCLFHRESVVLAGGFSNDTVTEDIDMIATLRGTLTALGRKYRIAFTSDPVCWTEAPTTVRMLARQRRRWQLGLMQTVAKHSRMMLNPRYGSLGLIGLPFHAVIEGFGSIIEALGTFLIPIAYVAGWLPLPMFLLFLVLAVGYGTLLSLASVLLEEITLRRYPKMRQVFTLIAYALIENLGYRQMVTLFRAQGVLRYLLGQKKWERVEHTGGHSEISATPEGQEKLA